MSQENKKILSPRIRVIQKLYGSLINPDDIIDYPKSQYKKFIKDVVQGTIERDEIITDEIKNHLNQDVNLKNLDKVFQVIIKSAVFEFLYKHNNPTKVIISEYLKTSEHFLEQAQIKYLNAILDKISKKIRAK